MGILKPSAGDITYNGLSIKGRSPKANVNDGISFIPQEKCVFSALTVKENLELAFHTREKKAEIDSRLELVHELFPVLKAREGQRAKTLSGGEQRMVALGMAILMKPQLLLLDEPSLGLSPLLVQRLMDVVAQIQRTFGTAFVLVEQNVKQALRVADRVYVMKMGRIILEETGEEFIQRGRWSELF